MPTDTNPWDGDLLGVRELGETFTKLVQSIDGSKVISIEAGFGRGKTFFRKRWAAHLRAEGEVVVEIDAQQSDHSGDPVVTFIGALVAALGPTEESRLKKAKDAGLKYTGVAARVLAKAVLRQGADDLIEAVEGNLVADDSGEVLKAAVDGFGDGMSKFASETIAAQLVAEEARQKEMPEQLDALRKALTADAATDRVVIIIDELDRCHPEYAIALLEAMKLVFDRDGYVFVLMVNAEYLEKVAAHRFGAAKEGEPYLEKFVDMRLSLGSGDEVIGEAARALALELPEPGVPFGEGSEFTVKRAAQVAADLAPLSGLSMRQIKRVLLRVELALRCYREVPVDVALLVWLGFGISSGGTISATVLPRCEVAPLDGVTERDWSHLDEFIPAVRYRYDTLKRTGQPYEMLNEVELDGRSALPRDRYRFFCSSGNRAPVSEEKGIRESSNSMIEEGLAPWYIPEHQAMLDAVHKIAAD